MSDNGGAQRSEKTDDFNRRLLRAKASIEQVERKRPAKGAAYSFGMRVATELGVAILVGFVFGWFLDAWLDTRPWFLLLFLPLGAAAGIMNVLRAARVEATRQQADLLRDSVDLEK
ncbi:ATP synthase protein I [Rhodoligotrophos appendicifer]|uniref:AtpZ/AtpI family protein n=1 Tax=Rhodoligotrophos appendicifer TaxID=987056 RepID=UPI00118485BA|nr:AtpZ/AtpI family protein [Rhodoligotrophos appendicifer]